MKKFLITAAVVLSVTAVASSLAAKKKESPRQADPVLMHVAGKPVHVSEFEYLYNKNNIQQQQPQSIDEYLEMFVDFKLKVADAEAAGIDTTASFRNEYENFRSELSAPYMSDPAVEDSLVRAAYSHMDRDVDVSHIMVPTGRTADEQRHQRALLDSLRSEILAGHADWDKVSAVYSVDRAVKDNGGHMGWIMAGRYPYPFEDAAYNTPVGRISEVVNSGYGFHIVKVNDIRPTKGKVHASHILKLTQGPNALTDEEAKAAIDSIYGVLLNGADFADMARRESMDGSASRGGDLGSFGPGQMVQPFDSIAFALADGQMSEPFATRFGYHIILCHEHEGVASLDSLRPAISRAISQDARAEMPHKAKLRQLRKAYGAQVDKKAAANFRKEVVKNNGVLNQQLRDQLAASQAKVGKFNGVAVTMADVMPMYPAGADVTDVDMATEMFEATVNAYLDDQAEEAYRCELAATNADYRNLLNEYHDGILLFEISNRNVWEKAVKDSVGLENYFQAHRGSYKWDGPRYKATIVFAQNDSVMALAQEYVATLTPEQKAGTNLASAMRDRFGKDVKVERVIAPKGANPITDYLGFEGPRPDDKGKWVFYFPVNGRVIDAPEEVIDVRGDVTTDYQTELGDQWVEKLHQTYPVTIDETVLDSLR